MLIMSIIVNLILAGALTLIVLGPVIRKRLILHKEKQDKIFQERIQRIVADYLQGIVKEDK